MKRTLKYVGFGFAVLLGVSAAVVGLTFSGLQPASDGDELNQIRIVTSGTGSTVGIVPIGEAAVALIDAGSDATGAPILADLEKRGLTAESVKAILFTHGHFDHIAAAGVFPQAQLLALAPEADLIAGLKKPRGPVVRFFPVKPTGLNVTRTLKEGEPLMLGDTTIKVFAVPGHTAGSAAYLINGILFLGDSADATAKGKLQSGHWIFCDDLAENEASLRSLVDKIVAQGEVVQALAFAHSGMLRDGLAPLSAWISDQDD
jgi:glyoxylase-like metal-dependent hydrolase (beta-lactamase superfamily II)